MEPSADTGWHPVAASTDLAPYHVYQTMLGGTELAVWRGLDGYVNVWENKCLHRGVRLTIGSTDGAELKCAYHGWRYANRSAGCTYIPAHPADAPARTICNTTFPSAERAGMVWTTLAGAALDALPSGLPDDGLPLRAIPIHAPVGNVVSALAELDAPGLDFHVQPVDIDRCIVRGLLADRPPSSDVVATLRRHNTELTTLRDHLESTAHVGPVLEPALRKTPIPTRPAVTVGRRRAPLRVRVRHKSLTATDVVAVELERVDGRTLPSASAGSHVDLHLPNGLVRQYSLTNGPGEADCYRIGVKLVADSRGGSQFIHDDLAEGDELDTSEPRPSFPLRRDATRTVLVAGGIGVTPLLSMAQTLARGRLPVELHYFARADDHLAFPEIRDALGAIVTTHVSLDPGQTTGRLREVIGTYDDAHHVYICGPGPMLEAGRAIAADLGWPDDAVHFEYFGNTAEVDRSSMFEISLARSARTLTVGPGESILDVLQQAGVPISSSCEQGACGTCVATVIEGEPDHQDVRLSAAERAAGDRIMTCVSRATTERLVLDL